MENCLKYHKKMNNQEDQLVAEDWWLKPSLLPTKAWSYDKGINGGYIADFKSRLNKTGTRYLEGHCISLSSAAGVKTRAS